MCYDVTTSVVTSSWGLWRHHWVLGWRWRHRWMWINEIAQADVGKVLYIEKETPTFISGQVQLSEYCDSLMTLINTVNATAFCLQFKHSTHKNIAHKNRASSFHLKPRTHIHTHTYNLYSDWTHLNSEKMFHEIGGKRVYRLEFRLSSFSQTLILHFNPSVNQVGHGCYGKFGLCKTLVHWIFHGELWIRLFLSEILWSVSEKSSEKRKEIILARSKRVKFNGYFQVVEADKRIFEKKEVLQQVTYRIPFRFGSFFQEFGIFAFILK